MVVLRDEIVWTESSDIRRLIPGPTTGKAELIDLDGDGRVDRVWALGIDEVGGRWQFYRHPGAPGLLQKVTNEFGGTTEITYQDSARAVGRSATSRSQQPSYQPEALEAGSTTQRSHHPVVAGITTNGNAGGSDPITRSFSYAEQRYDFLKRETLGFRMVERRDGANTLFRTLYHQIEPLRGQVERTETIAAGQLLQSVGFTNTTALAQTLGGVSIPGSYVTQSQHSLSLLWEGSAFRQSRLDTRLWDVRTGNLMSTTDGGSSPFSTADDLRVTFDYTPNSDRWLLSYPHTQTTFHGDQAVGRSELSYDDQPHRSAPALGELTRMSTHYNATSTSSDFNRIATQSVNYDGWGNIRSYRDERWHSQGAGFNTASITYEDDYNSFESSVTNRKSHTTEIHRNPLHGQVERTLSPNKHLRCWSYDPFQRLRGRGERSTPAAGLGQNCDAFLAAFDFPSLGTASTQHIETTLLNDDGTSLVSRQYFDGLARVYHEEDQAEAGNHFFAKRMSWGSRGEEACVSLPFRTGGQSPGACEVRVPRTKTNYDALLRPTGVWRNGSEAVTQTRYGFANLDDRFGAELIREVTTYGSPNRVQKFGVDARGDVVAIEETPQGTDVPAHFGKTVYTRDPAGRITKIDGPDVEIDGIAAKDENVMRVTYDFFDRPTRSTLPGDPLICDGRSAGREWSYTYNAAGDLTKRKAPNGDELRFLYDELGRLKRKDTDTANDPNDTQEGEDEVHHYDQGVRAVGLPWKIETRSVTTENEYDHRGDITKAIRRFGDHDFSFSNMYDRMGRLTETTYPDGNEVQMRYDGGSYVRRLQLNGNNLVDGAVLHPVGRMDEYTASLSGVKTDYTYSPERYFLTNLNVEQGGTTIEKIGWAHDTVGNLMAEIRADKVTTNQVQTFTYDGQHRLKRSTANGVISIGTLDYRYDAAGNLREIGDRELKYECSEGGPHAVTRFADFFRTGTYGYDKSGNVISRELDGQPAQSLVRDSSGRLEHIHKGANVDCYDYDHTGRRVTKEPEAGPSAQHRVHRLYVAPDYEVDLTNGAHELHLSVNGQRVARLRQAGIGNDGSGDPDNPAPITTTYLHEDRLGGSAMTTHVSGAVLDRVLHTPFGEIRGPHRVTADAERYLFTGQEYDSESKLSYFGARFYDPLVGRFMSSDPALVHIEEAFDALDQDAGHLNSYTYALNNPTLFRDPDGRLPKCFGTGFGCSGGGGGSGIGGGGRGGFGGGKGQPTSISGGGGPGPGSPPGSGGKPPKVGGKSPKDTPKSTSGKSRRRKRGELKVEERKKFDADIQEATRIRVTNKEASRAGIPRGKKGKPQSGDFKTGKEKIESIVRDRRSEVRRDQYYRSDGSLEGNYRITRDGEQVQGRFAGDPANPGKHLFDVDKFRRVKVE